MKKLLLALSLVITFMLSCVGAHAQQQYIVVASCGGQALSAYVGQRGAGYMDVTGNICSSAVGGTNTFTFTWPGTAPLTAFGGVPGGTVPGVNAGIYASVGSMVDGHDLTLGTTTQVTCTAYNTSGCTEMQILRLIAQEVAGGVGGGGGAVTIIDGGSVTLGNTSQPPCTAYNTSGCTEMQILRLIAQNIGLGGGGGAVTVSDGADVAEGATTQAACTAYNTTPCTNAQLLRLIAKNIGTGGGGGAITVADGADTTQGATTQTPCTAYNTSGCSNAQLLRLIAQLIGGSIPAGSNPIGYLNGPAVGSAQIATGQVSCGTGSTALVAARTGAPGTGRVNITITNLGTNAVTIGNTGVTTATGETIPGIAGTSLTLSTTAALYCVAGSAQSVSYVENF